MENSQLINQTSGETEYYTDPVIIEAARKVLGHIDLDPASSVEANKIVGADYFFTKEQDGLIQNWSGNVWMNHPFGRRENPLWVNKLVNEYCNGNVSKALCITYAATSENWFRKLMFRPQCYLIPRTNYYLPDGTKKKGVTKGSVVTYFGKDLKKFYYEFKELGEIKISVFCENIFDMYNQIDNRMYWSS